MLFQGMKTQREECATCDTRERRRDDVAETAASGLASDVADRRLKESIERKRMQLEKAAGLRRARTLKFVALLFDADSRRCIAMVDALFADCGDPQKVVERLFEPAARIIGDSWCADELDFVKATAAMARMQRLFHRLTAEHRPPAASDMSRRVLLTTAPGEQHTFGLSVVEDAFRRGSWGVDCCDLDGDTDIYRFAATRSYRIIGVSISGERLLPDLASMVSRLRSRSRNKAVVLMAGGSLIMRNPQGAIDAGFDLLAVDASSAVALAEAVVTSSFAAGRRIAAE